MASSPLYENCSLFVFGRKMDRDAIASHPAYSCSVGTFVSSTWALCKAFFLDTDILDVASSLKSILYMLEA
jgi:hypothetical protein